MKKSHPAAAGSALVGPVLLFLLLLAAAPGAARTENPRTWFFFRDKGPLNLEKSSLAEAQAGLSSRALARRAKIAAGGPLVDATDAPVYAGYLEQLAALGIQPVVVSRWLNGVSAAATPEQIAAAAHLECIARIQPVLRGHAPLPETSHILQKSSDTSDRPLDYGYSLSQNEQVLIPPVHQLGFYGQGVRIAVFDTGFRLTHEAFDSLKVVAQHDFIQNDDNLDNQEGERSDQNSHGTMVLSILAANKPGRLIGGAPHAEFILAKTEDVSQEIQAEEDHWIAAAEWAEGLGADIISTSLGYIDWYTYAEMDGNTAPITRAADLAVAKGVIVVVAAGNEGNNIWHYISAPADGDSVLAIGAVDEKGNVVSFSSRGPTADGRIKPDLMARGLGVACIAVPPASGIGTGYGYVSGTSAACPLAASCAALILCANPALTPMEVVNAMRQTATRSRTPDTDYGWGIIQTLAAVESTRVEEPIVLPERTALRGIYPNPAATGGNRNLTMALDLKEPEWVEVRLYDLLGREVAVLFRGQVAAGSDRRIRMAWPAAIRQLGSGVYFAVTKSRSFNESRTITLLQPGREGR
ncbi:MAG TPA: S8 family peptidase [bacterium]|nr:S8 family peptidase [bacterium]HPR88219.1 S8 family peptidase [bacterium]